MCWPSLVNKERHVEKVYNLDGQMVNDSEINTDFNVPELPEHVDNVYLNRDLRRGILGFRYENKQCSLTVYSSIEAKTFCWIMGLEPIRK